MGIKRSEKSLAYATQKLSGKELTAVPSSNFLGNLAVRHRGCRFLVLALVSEVQ